MAEKPQPVKVLYCEVCSLPPEYCEFGPDFEKCKPWLVNNAPHLYHDLLKEANDGDVEKVGEPLQSAGITSSGGAEGGATPTAASGDVRSTTQEEVKRLPGGKVKKKGLDIRPATPGIHSGERSPSVPVALTSSPFEPSTSMPLDPKVLLSMLVSVLEAQIFTESDFALLENIKQALEQCPELPFEVDVLLHLLKTQFWGGWTEYKDAIQANDDMKIYREQWKTHSATQVEIDKKRAHLSILDERERFLVAEINRLQAGEQPLLQSRLE